VSAKAALDKISLLSLLLIGVCCLRLPALFVFLAAIGLGLFTRNAVLAPVMGGLLALLLIGLAMDLRWHRRWAPLLIGAPSAATLYFFVFIERVSAVIYIALAGVILARILNAVVRRQAAKACET
jgi:hypothetical protein